MIPISVAVCVAWVYNAEAEHAAHIEHIKEENGGELPENPAYDFINRRSKPYPWGPNSLFYNPHVCYLFALVSQIWIAEPRYVLSRLTKICRRYMHGMWN